MWVLALLWRRYGSINHSLPFKKSRACTVVRKVLKKCRDGGGKKRLTLAATKLLKSWKKLDSTSTKLEKVVETTKQKEKEKREVVPPPSSSSTPPSSESSHVEQSSESSHVEQSIYCIDSIVREKSISLLSNVLSRGLANSEFVHGRYANWIEKMCITQQSIRTEWTASQLWLKSVSSTCSRTREINTKCAFAAEWQTLVTPRTLSWDKRSYLERSLHLGLQPWQQRYSVWYSSCDPYTSMVIMDSMSGYTVFVRGECFIKTYICQFTEPHGPILRKSGHAQLIRREGNYEWGRGWLLRAYRKGTKRWNDLYTAILAHWDWATYDLYGIIRPLV